MKNPSRPLGLSSLLLVLALLAGGGPAAAQNGIYDVSVANSGFFPSLPNDTTRSASFGVAHDGGAGGAQVVVSRYAFNLNADADGEAMRANQAGALHQVNFEVRSTVPYTLLISTALVGEMTRRSDGASCAGEADVSGVTGNASFELTSGSLSLDDPGMLFRAGEDRVGILMTSAASLRVDDPEPVESHVLGFSFLASVLSDSCEVAVRLGAQNASTLDCEACGYPGAPPRSQAEDGHLVLIEYVPAPNPCGNGVLDEGEECDEGQFNGAVSCCSESCQVKADGATCNDGLFCTGQDRCLDGECTVHPGEDCSELGPCFACNPVLDLCDPIVPCPATPTPTVTPVPTPTAPIAGCQPPFNEGTYNVNGANCTFCRETSLCSSECVGPAACFCPPGEEQAACCALSPCCENCPAAGSLQCRRLTCSCTPDDAGCCATLCPCAGDCDGNGVVSVDELVRGVNIAGGEIPLDQCISFNTAIDGTVATGELLAALDVALNGCVAP